MFSSEQKTWIVLEYGKTSCPTALKRKFVLHFNIKGREKNKYQPHLFLRVVESFKRNGISKKKSKGPKISKATPEAQQLVTEVIQQHPTNSIRQIAKRLDFTTSTTHKILRKQLKMKPYKFHKCQELSEDHKSQRLNFCSWMIDSNIEPQKIIFTDEKWFLLRPHPNRQNSRIWSIQNPYKYEDCVKQGGEKVVCWAAIINGRVLPIHWFENSTAVDGKSYLDLLKTKLWPAMRSTATRHQYYFQQDGAPCHCSTDALEFLKQKFSNRVISRRTDCPWPARSPDLSPLDYWFWSIMEKAVYLQKPRNIPALKRVVEEAAQRVTEEEVRRAVASFSRRARLCSANMGAHFEAEL